MTSVLPLREAALLSRVIDKLRDIEEGYASRVELEPEEAGFILGVLLAGKTSRYGA